VERWRTRALLGALVLIAAGGAVAVVLAQNDSLPSPADKGSPPLLMASAQNPLTVARVKPSARGPRRGPPEGGPLAGSGG